jgi:hypothetical protein
VLLILVALAATWALTGCPKKPATTPPSPVPTTVTPPTATQPGTAPPVATKGATGPGQQPGTSPAPGFGKAGGAGGGFGKAGAAGAGGRGPRMTVDEMFQRDDKNKDGKLTKDEVPERVWSRISRADTNGDGAITKDEMKAAREKAAAERKAQQPAGAPPGQ